VTEGSYTVNERLGNNLIRKRIKISYFALTIGMLLVSLIVLFPIIVTVSNSFMEPSEVVSRNTPIVTEENHDGFISHNIHFVRFGLIPDHFSLSQYRFFLFENMLILRLFWNSVFLLLPILIGQCILAPVTAYAFERMRWRGKEIIYFTYIVVMLLPMQLLLVPNFIVAGWLNIRDSYLAIILPALFHPFGVFLVRQQMKYFPKECLEAASLDGAGVFRTFTHIVRPNMSSVVAALVILLFADNWNIIDQAVVFISNSHLQPLSLYLGTMVSDSPGVFYAVSVFYLIPVLLAFLIGQERLAEGVQMSRLRD
jgi:multiple sugar transport system permease protein